MFDLMLGMLKLSIYKLIKGSQLKSPLKVKFSSTASIQNKKGSKIKIGINTSISRRVVISATENAVVELGDFSGINYNSVIVAKEKILIGSNVMIAPGVMIYDHDHVFNKLGNMRDNGFKSSPVIIEDNVWIGANSCILRGVRIGSGSVISAGCVISEDIPKDTLVLGNRFIECKKIKR